MKYIPGILHEIYQRPFYIQIGFEFIMSILKDEFRFDDLKMGCDYDTKLDDLSLDSDDVIKFRWFKTKQDQTAHIFIEDLIKSNGDIISLNRETIISYDFITHNRNKNGYFIDVSKIYQRDQKINQILN